MAIGTGASKLVQGIIGAACALLVATALQSCVAARIAQGEAGTDIATIKPGVERADVECGLGVPAREWRTTLGVTYCLYRYDQGAPPDAAGAVAIGALEAASLGLWELYVALDTAALAPRYKQGWLAVAYDGRNRVLNVFPAVTEFAEFPDDGHGQLPTQPKDP